MYEFTYTYLYDSDNQYQIPEDNVPTVKTNKSTSKRQHDKQQLIDNQNKNYINDKHQDFDQLLKICEEGRNTGQNFEINNRDNANCDPHQWKRVKTGQNGP